VSESFAPLSTRNGCPDALIAPFEKLAVCDCDSIPVAAFSMSVPLSASVPPDATMTPVHAELVSFAFQLFLLA